MKGRVSSGVRFPKLPAFGSPLIQFGVYTVEDKSGSIVRDLESALSILTVVMLGISQLLSSAIYRFWNVTQGWVQHQFPLLIFLAGITISCFHGVHSFMRYIKETAISVMQHC